GVHLRVHGPVNDLRQRNADRGRAVTAHEDDSLLAQALRQRRAKRRVADQHVGGCCFHIANLEHWCAGAEEPADVIHRLQFHGGNAEWNDGRRMTVHDSLHIRSRLVYFAVDESFQVWPAPARIDRTTLEVELHYVVGGHQTRRHAAGEQEAIRILVVAHADVTEAVDDALIEEDAVGRDQIA